MGRFTALPTITDDSALGGSTIVRSLRFDYTRDTYMERTPSSTGNRKTFTISLWLKIPDQSEESGNDGRTIFGAGGGGSGSSATNISIQANAYGGPKFEFLTMLGAASGGNYGRLITSGKVRDSSAWYHFLVNVDTTQSTASDRLNMYINGVKETNFSTENYPNQNANTYMNVTDKHGIGGNRTWSNQNNKYNHFGGYLAEINFIDGTALDASYFGYTEPQTGIWRPKKYTYGNYGTNGFHLDFSDNSSTTAATLGKDTSGNGNNFTPNNFGASLVDDVVDTPTNNFLTLNPLRRFTHNCTLSNGNLKATGSSESYPGVAANAELTSGKWYYEFVINSKTSVPMCGVCRNNYVSGGAGRILYRAGGHYVMHDGSEPTDPDAYGVGDVIGVAIDLDDTAGNIRFYKNGTLQTVNSNLNSLKSHMSISTLGGMLPYIQMYTGDACTVNFGQRPFSHTPPSGHRKLSSNNILNHSTTSILDPKKHFECLIYAGDDHNYRDITGLNFTPDFVWIKNRSQTDWHILSNSIVGMQNMVYSNTTDSLGHELNTNGYINKPIRGENGQGGFSVNAQGGGNVNELNENYVAWCWKGGSPNIETPTSGSVFFSVDNNYLDLGSYTDFQFGTGDYTIEMFVYHIDLGGQQTYVGDNYGNSAGVYFYKDTNQKIGMYYSGQIATSNTNIDSNKWVHVAASRSSGTLKLFQDGVEVGSGSDSTNLTATQLCIGDTIGGSSGCMHGYISNVRILKGTGLYTSNFTPPTSPLTNITNTKFLGCISETVAGLASVHPSPFSNNGTNYSSGSQMSGDILAKGVQYGAGGKDALFDGRIGQYSSDVHVSSTLSSDSQITWTPTSSISYSSKLEVWCYSPNGYSITVYYTLNGGSEQTMAVGGGSGFNNQTWITLATGSGTITSIKIRLTRSGSQSFVNWGAIRVDGSILVNDVTGKVVTPTMDDTRSVPPSPKNPFDGEFAVDGTRYLTAAAAGLDGGTITPLGSSINTKAGFSMIEYAGTDSGSSQTIPHGLNEPPVLWMWKNLTQNADWIVYTTAIDGGSDYLKLNDGPAANSGVSPWSTLPTSSVVTVGTNNVDTCNAGDIYIMYAWHSIPGYSKIGKYTGNGSSDGPYVEIGFKPALVIFKRTDSSSGAQWLFLDNKRNTYNPLNRNIYANLNNDDGVTERGDFLANGFKIRQNGTTVNASGGTYIYMAFADSSGNTPYQTENTGR